MRAAAQRAESHIRIPFPGGFVVRSRTIPLSMGGKKQEAYGHCSQVGGSVGAEVR